MVETHRYIHHKSFVLSFGMPWGLKVLQIPLKDLEMLFMLLDEACNQADLVTGVYLSQKITNTVDAQTMRLFELLRITSATAASTCPTTCVIQQYSMTVTVTVSGIYIHVLADTDCISCRYMKVLYKNWSRHISSWSPTLSPVFFGADGQCHVCWVQVY